MKKIKTGTKSDRSAIMRAVKSNNTGPELRVRTVVRKLGCRYRLHVDTLPGKPDIVFPSAKKAIFVNGCFWHGHTCARGSRVPKSNTEYWVQKIARNVKRDRKVRRDLRKAGWNCLTVWECSLKDANRLTRCLQRFLA